MEYGSHSLIFCLAIIVNVTYMSVLFNVAHIIHSLANNNFILKCNHFNILKLLQKLIQFRL